MTTRVLALHRGLIMNTARMSEENVNVARHYYAMCAELVPLVEAVGVTDDALPLDDLAVQAAKAVETLMALYDEEVEFKMVWAEKPSYGRAGVLQAVGEWMALMDEWRWLSFEFIDAGDTVVVDVVTEQIGKSSGVRTQERLFVALTMRDGKIRRHWEYLDRDEALQAAALQKERLDPAE